MSKYFKYHKESCHVLVPTHEICRESEAKEVLKKLGIKPPQLPKISIKDPAISDLDIVIGSGYNDITKIYRTSPTAGLSIAYRLVTGSEHDMKVFAPTDAFLNRIKMKIIKKEEDEKTVAKEIISAMKSATPPARGLKRITVGRDNLLKDFDECFESMGKQKASFCKIIIGEIGQGKTHFLQLLREEALSCNMVVSYIEVSKASSFGGFTKTYHKILNKITLPEDTQKPGNIESLFQRFMINVKEIAVREIKDNGFDPTNYKRVALVMGRVIDHYQNKFSKLDSSYSDNIRELFNMLLLDEDVGKFFPVARKDYGKRDMESFEALKELIMASGYNGIVILVDELEQDRAQKTFENMKKVLENPIPNVMWVFAGTNDLIVDKENGIQALLPDFLPSVNENKMGLPILSENNYASLTDKIIKTYDIAWDCNLHLKLNVKSRQRYLKKIIKSIGIRQLTPRTFSTQLIKALDDIRKGRKERLDP